MTKAITECERGAVLCVTKFRLNVQHLILMNNSIALHYEGF